MAQPEIDGVGQGNPAMLYGSNGAKWIAALIDSLGHLQVDVVSGGYLADAATQTTLALILAQLDVDLSTRAKETGGNLAAILAALSMVPPVSPDHVREQAVAVSIGTGSWTTVKAWTVSGTGAYYITDWYVACTEAGVGIEFLWALYVDGDPRIFGREGAARSCKEHLTTPIVGGVGQVVDLKVYHWAGSNKLFSACLVGYQV